MRIRNAVPTILVALSAITLAPASLAAAGRSDAAPAKHTGGAKHTRAPDPCARALPYERWKRRAARVYGMSRPTRAQLKSAKLKARCYTSAQVIQSKHIVIQLMTERALRRSFTDHVIAGPSSVFAGPIEGDQQTADGGHSARECIALKDRSTLGRWYLVNIGRYRAVLLHCDSGPYSGNRVIDITGRGVQAMGMDPFAFPTDTHTTARLLRHKPAGW
jgi:hypothetical protein